MSLKKGNFAFLLNLIQAPLSFSFIFFIQVLFLKKKKKRNVFLDGPVSQKGNAYYRFIPLYVLTFVIWHYKWWFFNKLFDLCILKIVSNYLVSENKMDFHLFFDINLDVKASHIHEKNKLCLMAVTWAH